MFCGATATTKTKGSYLPIERFVLCCALAVQFFERMIRVTESKRKNSVLVGVFSVEALCLGWC